MSDASIGAFTRLARHDPLAAARALKAAMSDEAYCALFEALTKVEGWEVSSVENEADDACPEGEGALRYERKTVTYDRWVPTPAAAEENAGVST